MTKYLRMSSAAVVIGALRVNRATAQSQMITIIIQKIINERVDKMEGVFGDN